MRKCEREGTALWRIEGTAALAANGTYDRVQQLHKCEEEKKTREAYVWELTGIGKLLCLLLGLAEEILIYLAAGISWSVAPVIVSGFLCVLLAIVSAGLLLALAAVQETHWGKAVLRSTSSIF